MRQWVIDTNVVVSGLLTPHGIPAQVLDAVVEGRIKLAHDARILAEYRDVLRRPRLKLNPRLVQAFLDGLRGQLLVTPRRITAKGLDPDDLIFVEAALATEDRTIVTGNVADFPMNVRHGVRILTPARAAAELKAGS